MKQQISQSKWIQNELKDGGLRQLIDSIDCASDVDDEDDSKSHGGYRGQQKKKDKNKISPRVLALARTKHRHPKFASFIDEMLLTAGVLQPATAISGGGEERLESILEGQGGRGPLVLAPVPSRGGIDNSESSSNECKSNSGESGSSSNDDSEEESDSSEEDSESEGEVKE